MGKINMGIVGKKFNLLTVLSFYGVDKNRKNRAMFLCKCDCGNEKILYGSDIKNGYVKSCGCYKGDIKKKECVLCNEIFQPTGKCAKYCDNCRGIGEKINQKRSSERYRYRKAVKEGTLNRLGIGRGGGQLKGEDSPYYKNGIGYFHNRSKEIKDERRYCERCNKDLKDAVQGFWCVHHKDHDRNNNIDDNFELLCKRCHQIEHKCYKALENIKYN